MSKTNHFKFTITEPNLEKTALAPDEPLGELSNNELDKKQVLKDLKRFLLSVLELASYKNYVIKLLTH